MFNSRFTILPFNGLYSDQFSCFLFEHSMEETVRTLLQNQDSLEGPKVDPLDLMKAYKVPKLKQPGAVLPKSSPIFIKVLKSR